MCVQGYASSGGVASARRRFSRGAIRLGQHSVGGLDLLEPRFDTATSVSRGRRQLINRKFLSSTKSGGGFCNDPVFVRLRMRHHVTFSWKNSIKRDEIIRLSGAASSFRLRWRLAKQSPLKDLRICGQETRTVSRTVGCETECQI
jgi:hypothetical protein